MWSERGYFVVGRIGDDGRTDYTGAALWIGGFRRRTEAAGSPPAGKDLAHLRARSFSISRVEA